MKRRLTPYYAVFFLTISFVLYGKAFCAYATENNRITTGVFIDEVDVGGMTAKEAKEAVDEFVKELKSKEIEIRAGVNAATVTLGNLGYSYKLNNVIDQALDLGTSGNLIKRYKELMDIANEGINYSLEYSLDEDKVREFVSNKLTEFNQEPVNASVYRKNGEMVYTDHVLGSKVDIEATVSSIIDAATKSWDRDNIGIDAYIEEIPPLYTRDVLELCNTILGGFSTEYADSAEGRASNLANGARLINNTLLYPGEVFSGYEHLAPFNSKNGYYVAGAYSKGKVIDSVGGGACQVTTTLYNAALEAELEIVERQAHSMTISYVSLSRDAAIAGQYKDLKFKNNTDVPILIQAYTKGRKITFNIWGYETRDTENRKIEYETRVLSETPPPKDVVEEDPTKPLSYKKVTQSAHTGYKTELYKVVYENGFEISRTLVNKSSYIAAPRYITIGTKIDEDTGKTLDSDEDAQTNATTEDGSGQGHETNSEDDEKEEVSQDKSTNSDGHFQDFYWDSDWDEEGLEDD